MKHKHLIAAAATLLLITGASAIQIDNQGTDNLTMSPGGSNTTTFDIQLPDNEDNIIVDAENTGQFSVSYSNIPLDQDGEIPVTVTDNGDSANYAKNITLVFEGERTDDEGNVTDFSQEVELTARTINPYETLEQTWVNKTQILDIDGETYNISQIQSSLWLNDNDIQIEKDTSEPLESVRVTLQDTIPGEYAKILVESKTPEESSFDIENSQAGNQNQKCTLFLSTQGGTTLQRGQVFYFQSVKDETGEAVGNTYVRLANSQTGDLIGKTTTDQYGYGSIEIPETLGAENPEQTISVVARVQKSDSNCDPTRKTLQPNTPYGNYIQNNEEYQLDLKLNNTLIDSSGNMPQLYGNLSGQVQTADKETVENGVMVVEKPDGQRTDFTFNKSGFNYSPENQGEYRVKATKTNYADSEWYTFNYADQCPDLPGTVETEGCTSQDLEIEFYTQGENGTQEQIPEDELEPGTYVAEAINEETGEVADTFSGTMTLEKRNGDSKEISFSGGTATISFDERTEYGLDLENEDESRYSYIRNSIDMTREGPSMAVMAGGAAGAVILLIVLAFLAVKSSEGSSSSSSGRGARVEESDIGGSLSPGGNNLQNQNLGSNEDN